jgi:hypothetical protein
LKCIRFVNQGARGTKFGKGEERVKGLPSHSSPMA